MHQGLSILFVCSQKSTERQDKHDMNGEREGKRVGRGEEDREHIVWLGQPPTFCS